MSRKRCRRSRGFTLVELIVVLVILVILAAIMVPALLGWIDRAKKQGAILECRSVVQAAQGQVAVYYGQDKSGPSSETLTSEMNREESLTAILDTSGVSGTIYNTMKLDDRFLVSYLEYETVAGMKVIFDRTHDPVYRISEKAMENKGSSAKEYYDSLIDSMIKDGYLQDGITTEELKKLIDNYDQQSNNLSKVLQQYYKDKVGSGENFSALTEREKEKLKNQMLEAGFTNNNGFNNLNGMSWRPIVTTEGAVVLVSGMGNVVGAPNSSVIYYNGNYYCYQHAYNGGMSSAWISDVSFSISDMERNPLWVNIGSVY